MTHTALPETRRQRRTDRSRVKGIAAIAVGAVLLLGGGTTLAYWTSTATVSAGTIESGNLNLQTSGTPTWTLQGAIDAAPEPVASIGAVRIVPGDVLVMTQNVDLTLVGDNLKAALTTTPGSVPTGLDVQVATTGVADAANLTPADSGALTVTVTITFPWSTPGYSETQFDLSDVQLQLTQVDS